jgi:uncharacterized cupin superfamily protein
VDFASNVWTDLDDLGDGVSGKRLERIRGETLAAAVWELAPGAGLVYHFHHGAREWLLVLRGVLALRTHDGERELREGDAVAFPRGRDGAHGMTNRSEAPVRYVVVAHHESPDVIEYPDEDRIAVMAKTTSSSGEPLELHFRPGDAFER